MKNLILILFIFLGCKSKTTEPDKIITDITPKQVIAEGGTLYYINHSYDDAEEGQNGEVDLTNEDLDLGQLSGFESAKVVGVRFGAIRIKKNQKIKNAFLQFSIEGNRTKAKPTELTIRAELSSNAPSFKNEKNNISSRSRTNAMATWIPKPWNPKKATDFKPQSPNLSTIIEEVINQNEWQEGNALVFIITGSGERDAVSFDGGGKENGPKLYIQLE